MADRMTEEDWERVGKHAAPQAIEARLKDARLGRDAAQRVVDRWEALLELRTAQVAAGDWPPADDIVALCTLQFSWGGLLDGRPADGYAVHLVRQKRRGGTPGPTLCGINRFGEDVPGWSVGGGISGPDVIHQPCPRCAATARKEFPGLPVTGSVGASEMAAELAVEVGRRG